MRQKKSEIKNLAYKTKLAKIKLYIFERYRSDQIYAKNRNRTFRVKPICLLAFLFAHKSNQKH